MRVYIWVCLNRRSRIPMGGLERLEKFFRLQTEIVPERVLTSGGKLLSSLRLLIHEFLDRGKFCQRL